MLYLKCVSKELHAISTLKHHCHLSSLQNVRKVAIQPRSDPSEDINSEENKIPIEKQKFIRLAVIGAPNSGKSTFINSIIGWKLNSISKKVHTTLHNSVCTYLKDDVQVALVDTPGLVTTLKARKHKIPHSILSEPWKAAKGADLIAVLVDCSFRSNCEVLPPTVISALNMYRDCPTVLLLNKVDLVPEKSLLLETICKLCGYCVDGHKLNPTNMMDNIKKRNRVSEFQGIDALVKETYEKLHKNDPKLYKRRKNEASIKIPDLVKDRLEYLSHYRTKYADSESHKKYDSLVFSNYQSLETKIDDAVKELPAIKNVSTHSSWPFFKDVFLISSINSNGIDDVREYICSRAELRKWVYDEEYVTDQSPKEIIEMCIREKLLETLKFQMPYVISISSKYNMDDNDCLQINATLNCPKKNFVKILIGPSGKDIASLSRQTSQDLMNIFKRDVKLNVEVTCLK